MCVSVRGHTTSGSSRLIRQLYFTQLETNRNLESSLRKHFHLFFFRYSCCFVAIKKKQNQKKIKLIHISIKKRSPFQCSLQRPLALNTNQTLKPQHDSTNTEDAHNDNQTHNCCLALQHTKTTQRNRK